MTEEQSELQMHIQNLSPRVSDFRQTSQSPSAVDFADVVEELAGALTSVYAELKSLRLK